MSKNIKMIVRRKAAVDVEPFGIVEGALGFDTPQRTSTRLLNHQGEEVHEERLPNPVAVQNLFNRFLDWKEEQGL